VPSANICINKMSSYVLYNCTVSNFSYEYLGNKLTVDMDANE